MFSRRTGIFNTPRQRENVLPAGSQLHSGSTNKSTLRKTVEEVEAESAAGMRALENKNEAKLGRLLFEARTAMTEKDQMFRNTAEQYEVSARFHSLAELRENQEYLLDNCSYALRYVEENMQAEMHAQHSFHYACMENACRLNMTSFVLKPAQLSRTLTTPEAKSSKLKTCVPGIPLAVSS